MERKSGHIERPELERYSDSPLFNTKAVVQQTGIPAPTLRAWESRYAILSPERATNAYRLYSERDIALIRWLKERVDSGMAISQAVALWRHLEEEYQKARQLQQMAAEWPAERRPAFHIALPFGATSVRPEGGSSPQTIAEPQPPSNANPPATSSTLPANASPALYNIRRVQEELIDAFKCLDDIRAQRLLASLLAVYPVEQVCAEVVTPVLWQVGHLWETGRLSVAIEHFASNFVRGFLTNLLYISVNENYGPLIICGCAPGEPHELAALMLALLLRRAGMRTIYLGQSIEIGSLLEVVREMQPVMLCISVTMPAYVATLIDLARRLQEQPEPRPLLVFGGQAFLYHSELAHHVPGGLYLSGPIQQVVHELRQVLHDYLASGPARSHESQSNANPDADSSPGGALPSFSPTRPTP
ncbi:MerR family transcriptional regulator [Thermogemmatispora onikobensis]|uniref:MerR family transcriptional regulator n=1 Tax=Thermogemmatispora onikobensis TaxID=732234 RepID=UPI000853A642|nr:cobalamin-dependent protein [Thermogemmatispora onikobensis]